MAESKITEWKQHLTLELRSHFEDVGESAVQFDAFHHRYSTAEKQAAALAWLAEIREQKEKRETRRYRVILAVAILTLIAAIVGIFI